MAQDPWEQAAKQFKGAQPDVRTGATASGKPPAQYYAQGQLQLPNGGQITSVNDAEPNDADWKVFNAQPSTSSPESTSEEVGDWMRGTALPALGNLVLGAGKGLLSTATALPRMGARYIERFETPEERAYTESRIAGQERAAQAQGTAQSIGKGIEQTGEFLVPGLGEEAATEHAIAASPKLAPLFRMGYGAATSGAVNKLQGGSFTGGAAAGGVASGIGEGLKALAPAFAESALGIRKADRTYGRQVGRTILDETRGFSPGSVAESAQSRLDELNPELDRMVDQASTRPNAARMALPPPATVMPMGEVLPPEMPGDLIPAAKMPLRNVQVPSESTYVDTLPKRDAFMTSGVRGSSEAPPFSGPGVWMRQPETGGGPLPDLIPNNSASLRGARGIVSSAMKKAEQQNASKEFFQLEPIRDFLARRFGTGEEIPEMVPPRDLVNLRRGLSSDFVHNWNPEVSPGVTGTARKAYSALSDELHHVAPETIPLDRRISNLIPVAKRAESTSQNAPIGQRVFNRFRAHTGALTSAAISGAYGYSHGGLPQAARDAALGLIIPEIIGDPRTALLAARTANSPDAILKSLTAGLLQSTRQKPKKNSDANAE